MAQWLDAGGRYVGVLCEIPLRVKERMRVNGPLSILLCIVLMWIDAKSRKPQDYAPGTMRVE